MFTSSAFGFGEVSGSPFAGTPNSYAALAAHSVAFSPNGGLLAVANEDSEGPILIFTVNPTTGVPTLVSNPSVGPISSVAFSPNGDYLAAAWKGGGLYIFSVNPTTGALTEVTGSPFGVSHPKAIAFSPDGSWLVATNDENGVSVYAVEHSTGAVKEVSGSPFGVSVTSTTEVALSPTGNLVATANSTEGVTVFTVNHETGALTEVPGSPFAITPVWNGEVTSAEALAFSPSGGLLATADLTNQAIGAVDVFSVDDKTGDLTNETNTLVSPPIAFVRHLGPWAVAFSADGEQLATANYSELPYASTSVFGVNQATGGLTEVAGSPFPTPGYTESVAFSPITDLLAVGSSIRGHSVTMFSGDGSPKATAPPESGRCAKVLPVKEGTKTVYHGGFTNSTCTKASATGSGKYEWLPGPTKTGFTTTIKPGSHARFETVGKVKVTCTGETGSGVMNTKTVSQVTMTFTGCISKNKKCTTSGLGEGELRTKSLEGILGWENKALGKAALDLQPVGGTGPFLEYSCAGSAPTTLSGSVLVPVKVGKALTTVTVKFAAKEGKQVPEAFEGGATDVLSNGKEQVLLTLTTIQTNEEAVEIDPAA
jgi:WD40 repeat protein